MTRYDELADALKGEVLTEMAQSFFTARKAIDDEVELFEKFEADLLVSGQRALCRFRLLLALLWEGEKAEEFLQIFRIDPSIIELSASFSSCMYLDMPFAFVKRKRFIKLFVAVFGEVQAAFAAYTYGTAYRREGDPVPRRTIGWNRYVEWGSEINDRIEAVNMSHAPSSVLGLARSFDVERQQQQSAIGCSLDGMDCSLDASLYLKFISVEGKGYGGLPEWPAYDEAYDRIYAFAKELYDADPERAEGIMKELAKGDGVACCT